MKSFLILIAIVLSVLLWIGAIKAILNDMNLGMGAGSELFVFMLIVGLVLLSFTVILIAAIYKCSSWWSLALVWGVTIVAYGAYPIISPINQKIRNVKWIEYLEYNDRIKTTLMDNSSTIEQYTILVAEQYSIENRYQFSYTFRRDSKDINHYDIYAMLSHNRTDLIDAAIEQGLYDVAKNINIANYWRNKYQSDYHSEERDMICKQVIYLLDKGCNIEAVCEGMTLLFFVSGTNEVELFYALIDRGAKLSIPLIEYTPLHIAAEEAGVEIVDYLIKNGVDVNKRDGLGRTPLFKAVDHYENTPRREKVISLLLNNGARCNFIDAIDQTILFYVNDEFVDYIGSFIRKGANVHILTKYGYDALYNAVSNRNFLCAKELIKHGADVTRLYNGNDLLSCVDKEYYPEFWNELSDILQTKGVKSKEIE